MVELALPLPPANAEPSKILLGVGGHPHHKHVECCGRAYYRRVRNLLRGRSVSCESVDEDEVARKAVRKQEEAWLRKYRKSIKKKIFLDLTMYEQLGISDIGFDVTEEQIKKAYMRVLIEHHPDKSGKAENDPNYLAVQKAFETLTDPQKKRAYDSQCNFSEWIPSGAEKIAQNEPSGEGKDFYELYGPVFKENARFSEHTPVPELGNDETPIETVYDFYAFWHKFESWRDFTHGLEHDVDSAEHRDQKRWMTKKNEIVAKKKKKDEYRRLANLVDRAMVNDPRIRRVKQAEKDKKLRAKREKEEAVQRAKDAERLAKEEAERAIQEKEEAEKAQRQNAKQARDKQKKLFRKIKKAFRELMAAAGEQGIEGALDVVQTETVCESVEMEPLQSLVAKLGSVDAVNADAVAEAAKLFASL